MLFFVTSPVMGRVCVESALVNVWYIELLGERNVLEPLTQSLKELF